MEFKPDKLLLEAIDNRNTRHIRSAISSYMVSDPSDSKGEIMQAVGYVEDSDITDFWQTHDQREFKGEPDWDEDYFGLLQAQLMTNFSEERLKHARKVGEKVHGIVLQKEQNTVAETGATLSDENQGSDLGKLLPILTGIGLLVVAVLVYYLVNKK